MYLNASKRKAYFPCGTVIIYSKQADIHRCFQAAQTMLREFKQQSVTSS
jgi:hypothetical protein